MDQIGQLKEAIKDLYHSVEKLNDAFSQRKFTPDGRMIGDIGEAIASLRFDVVLDEKSQKDWDGYRIDKKGNKRMVQVKTTQKDETYLKKPPCDGDLLVFKIRRDGEYELCYDGSALKVWDSLSHRKADVTGAKMIDLKRLKQIK